MLVLRVREGELESGDPWVFAWLAPDGVVYVGATALHPEAERFVAAIEEHLR